MFLPLQRALTAPSQNSLPEGPVQTAIKGEEDDRTQVERVVAEVTANMKAEVGMKAEEREDTKAEGRDGVTGGGRDEETAEVDRKVEVEGEVREESRLDEVVVGEITVTAQSAPLQYPPHPRPLYLLRQPGSRFLST